jgi:KR domain
MWLVNLPLREFSKPSNLAGGLLLDALLAGQGSRSLREVLAPKLEGGLNLRHCILRAKPFQALLLFSSIAALLGNVGQVNYAAANAALDVMADLDSSEVSKALSCF